MATWRWVALVWGGAAMSLAAPAEVPLTLVNANLHDLTVTPEQGGWELQTTGADPYVFTGPLPADWDPAQHHVLAFEFFSATGTDALQVFAFPPLSEAHSFKGPGLAHSEGWSNHAVELAPVFANLPGRPDGLRLDFGNQAGKTIRLRNLRLRPPTPQELALVARKAAHQQHERQLDGWLRAYLHHAYPGQVARVVVEPAQVRIQGTAPADGWLLAEVPLWAELTDPAGVSDASFDSLTPVTCDGAGQFAVTLPRQVADRDRLLARWALVERTAAGLVLRSHARYADDVVPRTDLPAVKPRTRKGLGGFHLGGPVSDLDDLGIGAVTVNLVLNALLSTTPQAGWSPYRYGGRTWYVNDGYVAGFDKTFGECLRHQILVSVIVLIAHGATSPPGSYSRLLAHPDADPAGIFPMPDVASREGLTAYAAGLNYLAERYSRPGFPFGRVHHWILHNEVNAGWVWTNAGEKTDVLYLDLYQKSMRTAWLIARQYDPHSQPFISLEHHWTMQQDPHCHPGQDLLNLLVDFSAAEGDFEWAIAFHPYPQDLFEPKVWRDTQVRFAYDTPKITFKNLEVLDAWVKQPRVRFQGRPRVVHLSEQGLNSRDYGAQSLQEQAAGMAYTWHKLQGLDSIEAFQYHNWIDNRGEGGLRIGLRRFPDDKDEPLGRKPIWFVYQALETARQAEATAFALPLVGVRSWDEVHHTGEIR